MNVLCAAISAGVPRLVSTTASQSYDSMLLENDGINSQVAISLGADYVIIPDLGSRHTQVTLSPRPYPLYTVKCSSPPVNIMPSKLASLHSSFQQSCAGTGDLLCTVADRIIIGKRNDVWGIKVDNEPRLHMYTNAMHGYYLA